MDCRIWFIVGFGDLDFRVWVATWVSGMWILGIRLELRCRGCGFKDLGVCAAGVWTFKIWVNIWVSRVWISGFGLKLGFQDFGFQESGRNLNFAALDFRTWV